MAFHHKDEIDLASSYRGKLELTRCGHCRHHSNQFYAHSLQFEFQGTHVPRHLAIGIQRHGGLHFFRWSKAGRRQLRGWRAGETITKFLIWSMEHQLEHPIEKMTSIDTYINWKMQLFPITARNRSGIGTFAAPPIQYFCADSQGVSMMNSSLDASNVVVVSIPRTWPEQPLPALDTGRVVLKEFKHQTVHSLETQIFQG